MRVVWGAGVVEKERDARNREAEIDALGCIEGFHAGVSRCLNRDIVGFIVA